MKATYLLILVFNISMLTAMENGHHQSTYVANDFYFHKKYKLHQNTDFFTVVINILKRRIKNFTQKKLCNEFTIISQHSLETVPSISFTIEDIKEDPKKKHQRLIIDMRNYNKAIITPYLAELEQLRHKNKLLVEMAQRAEKQGEELTQEWKSRISKLEHIVLLQNEAAGKDTELLSKEWQRRLNELNENHKKELVEFQQQHDDEIIKLNKLVNSYMHSAKSPDTTLQIAQPIKSSFHPAPIQSNFFQKHPYITPLTTLCLGIAGTFVWMKYADHLKSFL